MHFWIDKRSQQCGFGRSRVAASLSHAGSGLSYGHPPRRAKSSSCSTMPPVHRSLPQTPYDCHQPGTSRQSQSQSQSQSHSQYANNNSLHGQQHQQQHQMMQQHSTNNNNVNSSHMAATGTPTASNNITNNNASGTASAAAVLTGSGTIVPLVARGSRYHPRTQQQTQHQYSYHHPQFGNMVPVRHHDTHQQHQQQQQQQQLQQQQHSGVYADDAYSAYHHNPHQQQQQLQHHHQQHISSSHSHNHRQSAAYATPRRHNSSSSMRQQPAAAATSVIAVAPVASAPATSAQTTHSNQLQQQHHALLQHADSQLLPSHLKCGMCASLVLASVFVAGTKFYFDHQGTGLEVLIFCAFSATFFLAACMVSLCRIPKGLLSGRGGARATVCHSRGVNAAIPGSSASAVASCLMELSDVRYLEERQVTTASAATAGPPPYHIAILLPEQTAAMGKQMPLDESPPPSYDKILV
ncbi:GL25432 [Drosophila persimilis]|uniref:GL25432 n=1 Tax=Drosophila persimilis TaxID=7234 RepID=B4H8N0_DROPE|nr:myb-like protein AA [Drosophila persimilis]XP_026848002.1 myb-like protein AA [Drosophila persimilis]EDW35073.1 GL25432 [Drosophila persimilis]